MSKLVSLQLNNLIKSLSQANNISANTHFIVGVSGGKDSMALLHLLHSITNNVHAVHINYGLRAEESDADQAVVEHFCAENNITITSFSAPSFLEGNFQNNAREFRYKCFNDVAFLHSYEDYYICTAHHLQDQVETLLHRVFEGKSAHLFKGMQIVNGQYFKPLLETSLRLIDTYVEENAIPWRLDKSNLEINYRRNYLRNTVIPELVKSYPSFEKNILKLINVSTTLDHSIEYISSTVFENNYALNITKLLALKPILQISVLNSWFHSYLFIHDVSEKTTKEIMVQLNKRVYNGWEYLLKSTAKDSNEWILNLSENILYAFKKSNYFPIPNEQNLFNDVNNKTLNINKTIYKIVIESEARAFNSLETTKLWFQYPGSVSVLCYRSIQLGDKFKPIGLNGKSKKVYDILAEHGIPSYLRKFAVLIFANSEALALLFPNMDNLPIRNSQLGLISEPAKVTDKTKPAFTITKTN